MRYSLVPDQSDQLVDDFLMEWKPILAIFILQLIQCLEDTEVIFIDDIDRPYEDQRSCHIGYEHHKRLSLQIFEDI